MPVVNFSKGLHKVNVRRRAGVLSNYNIILYNKMILSDFYLIDNFLQAEVKNFGQLGATFKSEVYILEKLDSVNSPDNQIEISPLFKNGIAFSGSIVISNSEIVGVLVKDSGCNIYATTNLIKKETPDIYTIASSVNEIWESINP